MQEKIANKYKAMQKDLEKVWSTGRLARGFTPSDYYSIVDCGKELLKKHAIKIFIKNVADYFKKFGFMVTMDFDNVHYVIVEA